MTGPPEPLVWLPFDPAELAEDRGGPPAGLRYETVDPTDPAHELPGSVAEVEVYVPPYAVGPAVAAVLSRMTSLRYVLTLTAGVDNLRGAVPPGVTLCNGRGIHDASTAELAVALLLGSLRGVPGFVRDQDRRLWRPGWHDALADRTVVIVGYGAIGAALEARLTPFECTVVRVAQSARDGVHPVTDLPRLLPRADVVVVVVPLTDATRGLVDASFLAAMPDGALLVNVSRGPVVDQQALLAELTAGRLRAALDVTDPEPLPSGHPLWRAPNLLISPHVGGSSSAMWPRAHRLVREQLARIAVGAEPVNVVTPD